MQISRKSLFSGITRTKELDITPAEWKDYESGTLIQNAFPRLSADDREFIMTGAVPEEWDAAFKED